MKSLPVFIGVSVLSLLVVGCSTTKSVKARPLHAVYGEDVDLSRFDVATVEPFQITTTDPQSSEAGVTMANAIARRLEYDFGHLFREVRVGEPQGTPNEVVVTGRITDYEPGSRAARLLGPGIGRAKLEGNLVVEDGATRQPLTIAPIHKLWAWGHSVGAMKGIDDMVEETAAAAANMIAREKGWQPPTQASTGAR